VGEFQVESIDGFVAMMEKACANEEAGTIMAGYHEMVQANVARSLTSKRRPFHRPHEEQR
jgi:hypothetical protein